MDLFDGTHAEVRWPSLELPLENGHVACDWEYVALGCECPVALVTGDPTHGDRRPKGGALENLRAVDANTLPSDQLCSAGESPTGSRRLKMKQKPRTLSGDAHVCTGLGLFRRSPHWIKGLTYEQRRFY